MDPDVETPKRPGAVPGLFATTRWSVVMRAGDPHSPAATEALTSLYQVYRYPLYAFARRTGVSPADAEDLTQGFFAHFIRHNLAGRVEQRRGRFRSFLLAAFKNYMAHERDRAGAQKRGGGRQPVSLDAVPAEERFRFEPADPISPEQQYDLAWANALLAQVLDRLEEEFAAGGRGETFARLKSHLLCEPAQETYSEIAAVLGLTETAVKGTVFRMRGRYRELLRLEVAQTVATPAEVDEELAFLRRVVSGG